MTTLQFIALSMMMASKFDGILLEQHEVCQGDTLTATILTIHTPMPGFAILEGPRKGSATMNRTGTFSYVPVTNFVGVDDFTYRMCPDAGACDTGKVVINVLPKPITTITTTDPTCYGADDGSIMVEEGSSYSYEWNTGARTPSLSGIKAGDYQVTVTNPEGCSVIESVSLGDAPCVFCPPSLTGCSKMDFPAYQTPADFTAAGGSYVFPCRIEGIHLVAEQTTGNSCPIIIIRTYELRDACGNTQTCEQEIIIRDNIAPGMECPASIDVACVEEAPAYNTFEVFLEAGGNVFDNCGVDAASFKLVSTKSTSDCPKTIIRTYLIRDHCGNSTTCTHTVTIYDLEAPVLICPIVAKPMNHSVKSRQQ